MTYYAILCTLYDCLQMAKVLKESIEKRFAGIFDNVTSTEKLLVSAFKDGSKDFSDAAFIIATTMDPRVHFDFLEDLNNDNPMEPEKWVAFETTYKATIRSIVIKLADKLASSPSTSPIMVPNTEKSGVAPIVWMQGIAQKRRISAAGLDDTGIQWDLFLSQAASGTYNGENLLQYWKKHAESPSYAARKLANMARYYGCMNVTSAGAERVFSMAGHIFSAKRASMKPSTLATSVYVKLNKLLTSNKE